MTDYTRSGARRAGDDYQDLLAADLLVEFLEQPDRYRWVQVEADDAKALDDVVAMRADGSHIFRQVKFTVDPDGSDYLVSWDYLLNQEAGKRGPKDSLLIRWSKSLQLVRDQGPVAEASLVTNRRADPEFAAHLSGGHVLLSDLPAETSARISAQIGEAAATTFFRDFSFHLEQPALEALEDGLKRRFRKLGGDDHGWLALLKSIRQWATKKGLPPPDGRVGLSQLRNAALWHELKTVPQEYAVPQDFVVPSVEFHAALAHSLRTAAKPVQVIWGSPGSGKSTYLSRVVADLTKDQVPVIRHHYFLDASDRSKRFDFHVAAESLMHQLQARYADAVASASVGNPNPDDLAKWLGDAGEYFRQRGTNLVVIVDGLDHVWRERRSTDEVNELLRVLLPPPTGVVVLVGTQKLAQDAMPFRLTTHTTTDDWNKIPPLSGPAIKEWVEFNGTMFGLPEDGYAREQTVERMAAAFLKVSGGHPLHLKFSLKALRNRGGQVHEDVVLALPACLDGEIVSYYDSLWRNLPEEGRLILHLLAATDFQWPESGLFEVLAGSTAELAVVGRGLEGVCHLLSNDGVGYHFFHGSVAKYVGDNPQHQTYRDRLLPKVLRWLEADAPDLIRWSHMWRMQAEAGQPTMLIDGPNEEWARTAIAQCRPIEVAASICREGYELALDAGRYADWVRLGILHTYLKQAEEHRSSLLDALLPSQLQLSSDPDLLAFLLTQLHSMSTTRLVAVAEHCNRENLGSTPEACLELVRNRQEEVFERSGGRRDEFESYEQALVHLSLVAHECDANKITKRVAWLREHDVCARLFDDICDWTWCHRRVGTAQGLLQQALPDEDAYAAGWMAVRLASELNLDLRSWNIHQRTANSAPLACYEAVVRRSPLPPRLVPAVQTTVLSLGEHDLYGDREHVVRWFHRVFFSALSLRLLADGECEDLWLRSVGDTSWAESFTRHLVVSAAHIASRMRGGDFPTYGDVYLRLSQLPRPDWREDRAGHLFSVQAAQAIAAIASDVLALGAVAGRSSRILAVDISQAESTEYWVPTMWIARYTDNQRVLLTTETARTLLDQRRRWHDAHIQPLDERVEEYAALARLALLHGPELRDLAREFIDKAAAGALGYGNHKDALLFHVIKGVDSCGASATDKADWVCRLGPSVAAVGDFTDGDETRYLPTELGAVLARVMPERVPDYYSYLVDAGEYSDAEDFLRIYLATADLTEPAHQSLAKTVVDDRTLQALQERALTGDAGARVVVAAQEFFLGSIPEKERELGGTNLPSSSTSSPDPKDYPPDRLEAFIAACTGPGRYVDDRLIEGWLDYWAAGGQANAALAAISLRLDGDHRLGRFSSLFDGVFVLCLRLRGRDDAYRWLVRAQRDSWGWSAFSSSQKAVERRWKLLMDNYPEKAMSFAKETLRKAPDDDGYFPGPYDCFARLAQFLGFAGQPEHAKAVTESAIAVTLGRFGDLRLPKPSWIPGK